MTSWIYWIISALILLILISQNELEYSKTYVNKETSLQVIELIKNTTITTDFTKLQNENIKQILQNQKILLELKLNERDLNTEKINEIINKYLLNEDK